jgi:DNA-binding transcriptional regulator LsrR (DeoR family)
MPRKLRKQEPPPNDEPAPPAARPPAAPGGGAEPKVPQRRGRPRSRPEDVGDEGTRPEIISMVVDLLLKGENSLQVAKKVGNKWGLEMHREVPYRLLRYAFQQEWVKFHAPPEVRLAERIQARWDWLVRQRVEVVETALAENVACRGAEALVQMVKELHSNQSGRDEIHIGFSSGHAMRWTCKEFARILRTPAGGLPRKIVCHSLVGGFSLEEPNTSPNSFFTYLEDDLSLHVDVEFVSFNAVPLAPADWLRTMHSLPGIAEAFKGKEDLDIIVTSASAADSHGLFADYMTKAKKLEALKARGYQGDMLWQALGPDGPIEPDTEMRAMTLVDLKELPQLIGRGKRVLLVLAPCYYCKKPKPELLRVILSQPKERQLITDLVVDSRTARGAIK